MRRVPGDWVLTEHECSSCGSVYQSSASPCLEEFCLVRGIPQPNKENLCPPCQITGLIEQGWAWERTEEPNVKRLVPPAEEQV